MTTTIGLLAVTSYLVAALCIFKTLKFNSIQSPRGIRAAWLGVVLQTGYLASSAEQYQTLDFSLFSAGVLITLFINLIWLLAALDKPVEKLGIGILPITIILLGLDMLVPEPARPLSQHSWPMMLHILSSIIAFSLLNVAALQAILLVIQEQQLRSRQPLKLMLALPPLQHMESFMFQMVAAGLLSLTVSLISGFVFIDNLFAQHLVHKTLLSISAWAIFSGLLVGRLRYGWRGKTAAKWLLTGFALLLMGYFGSKLVLELILQRV